ncbi:MAG: type 2 periplasmic-binding domain-containing protein [Planctomycetota bacterium]|jgi:putative aldouronate transport system substrate-binding protein
MKAKICVYLVLAAVLCVVGVVLKRLPEEAAKRPPEFSAVDWGSVEDDLSEHLTLRVIAPSDKILPDALPIRLIEERFNVTMDFGQIHPTAWAKKKPMLLASGRIPDIFFDSGTGLSLGIKHGFVMPIPRSLLVKYCPSQVKLVNRFAPYAWPALENKGFNYGVPALWLDSRFPRTGTWRMDWLKNVGIDRVPETLVEMEEAFTRLTFKDPDGNGRQDTWGMSGDLMNWYTTFTEVFGAHGVMPYDFQLNHKGEFVYGGIQPGAKETLALLKRWNEKGIIHPDFIADRWFKEVNEKFYSGKTGYVNYMTSYEAYNQKSASSLVSKMKQRQPTAEVVPSVLPAGPSGKRGHRVWGASGGGAVFGRHLAETPKKVIRFLKIMETMHRDEAFFIRTVIGDEGKHWKWSDASKTATVQLDPYNDGEYLKKEGLRPNFFVASSLFAAYPGPEVTDKYQPAGMAEFKQRWRNPDWGTVDLIGNPEVVQEVAPLADRLRGFQIVAYAEFIRGERSLDTFDDFAKEWMRLGGDRFVEASKKYYQRQLELTRQMKDAIEKTEDKEVTNG